MGRSGYSDSCEGWALIRWRGAVSSAIRGNRGQSFLREMIEALDAMPEKALIVESLKNEDGAVCAMGAVALKRGVSVEEIEPTDGHAVAQLFGISHAMAAEIAYLNDEVDWHETPQHRWKRMREWAVEQLKAVQP